MVKDKSWLKQEILDIFWRTEIDDSLNIQDANLIFDKVENAISQLDEPETLSEEWIENHTASADTISYYSEESVPVVTVIKLKNILVPKQDKPVIPQFVADYIEKWKYETLIMHEWFTFDHDDQDEDKVSKWLYNNTIEENRRREYLLIDAIRNGYEVEKEILWEIPMPDLKTSDGHIQYLTYAPEAKTYFAGRKNGQLKQTFNAKDLARVPEQYRRYAELCNFNKIEEEVE